MSLPVCPPACRLGGAMAQKGLPRYSDPMTDPAPQQFKSARSDRYVVPGWMNLVPGQRDSVEIQLNSKKRT